MFHLEQKRLESELATSAEENTSPTITPIGPFQGFFTGLNSQGLQYSELTALEEATDPQLMRLLFDSLSSDLILPRHSPSNPALSESYLDHSTIANEQRFVRLSDSEREFFIVNHFKTAPGQENIGLIAFGEERALADLPRSGVKLYASDDRRDSDSMDLIGSTLISNGAIANPGFTSLNAVDFGSGKFVGITVAPEMAHDDMMDSNQTQSNEMEQHHYEGLELPFTLYFGRILTDGTVEQLQFYNNLGFMPSHVQLPGALSSGTQTYGLETTLLNQLQGDVKFYGSDFQGITISAMDANNTFVAAAMEEQNSNPLQGLSGNYIGFGRGLKASGAGYTTLTASQLDTLNIMASFENNYLSGSVSIDNTFSLSIGENHMAIDQNIVVGNLVNPIGGTTLTPNSSFLFSAELPRLHMGEEPEDVMWGTWNIVESDGLLDPIIYTGRHNFWASGIPTTINGSQSTVATKLGIANSRSIYKGGLMHTVVDEAGAIPDLMPRFGTGWNIMSTSNPLFDHTGPSVAVTGPVVVTDRAEFAMVMNFNNNSAKVLGRLPDGSLLIANASSSNVTENGFDAQLTYFSMDGLNYYGTLYESTLSANTLLHGKFAGSNAKSLFFEYQDEASSGDPFAFGVGVGSDTTPTATLPTTESYSFVAHGAVEQSGGGMVYILTNPDINLKVTASYSSNDLSGSMLIDGSTDQLNLETNTLNTFIDRHNFFATLVADPSPGESIQFAANFPDSMLDPANTFILGMPGLEEFNFITWGVWAGQDTAGTSRAFGYFAGGVTHVDGAHEMIPDYSTIAAWADPVVTYHGRAIGTLIDGAMMQGLHGSATVDVNFNTAAVKGNIDLGPDAIVDISGSFSSSTSLMTGSAQLNANAATAGSFRGGFYGDEMAGSFGASDGTKRVIGAFGAKANTTIPLQSPAVSP